MGSDRGVCLVVPSLVGVGGVEDLVARLTRIFWGRYDVKVVTFDSSHIVPFFEIKGEIIPIGHDFFRPFRFLIISYKLAILKRKLGEKFVFISVLPIADVLNGFTSLFVTSRAWSLWVINIRNNPDNLKVFRLRWFLGICYKGLEKVFCIDDSLLKEPSALFRIDSRKVKRFFNFVSDAHFAVDLPKTVKDGQHITILYCARLEPVKNPFSLIEISKYLSIKGLDAQILVVGSGSLEQELIACANKSSLLVAVGKRDPGAHMVFLAPEKDQDKLFFGVDLCILPSKSEGFPTIIAIALARGVPILASDVFSGLKTPHNTPMQKKDGFSYFNFGGFGPVPVDNRDCERWANAIKWLMLNRSTLCAEACRSSVSKLSSSDAVLFWDREFSD